MLNRLSISILVICALGFGCGQKHDQHHHGDHASDRKEWPPMDDFHMVMAEAFHPYKDSANLQPAREKAAELVASAKKWQSSEIPEGLDKDQVGGKLTKLTALSEEFSREVATGTDETIANKLTELHDLFHELQNDFYAGAGEGHHDGDKEGHEHH